MSLQVDGKFALDEQERQLQFAETFFVEVIDYSAGENGNNDLTTKPISGAVDKTLHLRQVADANEVSDTAKHAAMIVFDRIVFVTGQRQRVLGFRS